jgi:succinyl-CoA synthetase alpha subunit
MLQDIGVPIADDQDPRSRDYFLTIGIDRSNCKPGIVTSYSIGGESPHNHAKTHVVGMDKHVDASTFASIASELNCKRDSFDSLTKILAAMMDIFFNKEAFFLSARLSRDAQGQLAVARSSFTFDDAAFRSGMRHGDIQEMRDFQDEVPEEVEAEKDGIVYIK